MKELLKYIIESITGKEDISITDEEINGEVILKINCDSNDIGLIIGKNGQTIKSIQNILRVKARLEKKSVYIKIEERKSD